jgi:excisionase family DNA binding protein
MSTLTIKEAAQHFDVSERTIRRRIAAGELRATRAPMAQGYQVFVHLDDNHDTDVDKVDNGPVKVDTEPRQAVEVFLPTVTEQPTADRSDVKMLLMLLDQRDQRIEELAERAGRADERAKHLEDERDRYKQEVERLRKRTFLQWLLGR